MSAQPIAPARLSARTVPGPVDLLDRWRAAEGFLVEREGAGLVGVGTAAAVVLLPGEDQAGRAAAAADSLLAGLGPDAVAVAALPFDGSIPARLAVPQRTTRVEPDGRTVEVIVDGVPSAAVPRSATSAAHPGAAPRRRPEPGEAAYAAAVAEAVRRIRAGRLDKVVLARTLVMDHLGWVDPVALLRRLRARDPGCYTIAARGARDRLLVGASPEMLLRRRGDAVLSTPLAGSAPRSADPAGDRSSAARLLASPKDRREHRLVVEAVGDALAPYCRDLDVEAEPHLMATGSVWHLATAVRGRLRPGAPSALSLAAALHPTPAVCGTPRAAAREVIAELEPLPRGLYSGMAGWVDGRGDGEWAVTLRCAILGDGWARLYAGAGIVDGSEPESEVAETEVKFRALLDALLVDGASG